MNTASPSFDIKTVGKKVPSLIQTDISTLINRSLTFLIIAAGIISLFYLLFSGIKYITSGGNPKETEAARNQITAAVIGLIIVFLSFTVIKIIGSIIGATKLLDIPF